MITLINGTFPFLTSYAASRSGGGGADTVIFIHIGKTAGSTFNFLLNTNIYEGNSYGAYDNNLDVAMRSSTGVYEPEYVSEMILKQEAEREQPFAYLPGHMRFGLHKFIDRPSAYITFLRHPVQRIVSAYNYVRSMGWLAKDQTLNQFVETDFLGNSNAMVRQLIHDSSVDTKESPALLHHARQVTHADLKAADKNLKEKFVLAAPTDRFDEALFLLARRQNWPLEKMRYQRANVTPNKIPAGKIHPQVVAKILARNELDAKLFDAASKRFDTAIRRFSRRDRPKLAEFIQHSEL